jgi:hypothetical protein
MMVDVARVRDSGLASDETPEACWAAFLLWCAAWHQVPAASIPHNDQWIAKQAGYAQRGRIDTKAWAKVREGALRGFVLCSDGLLYHPVVAEKALECWLDKLARTLSSGAGNAKRWNVAFDPAPIEAQIGTAREMLTALNPQSRALTKRRNPGLPRPSDPDPVGIAGGGADGIPPGSQGKGREEKGREEKGSSSEANASDAGSASQPAAFTTDQAAALTKEELWSAGKSLLESAKVPKAQCGTFIGGLVKEFTAEIVIEVVRAAVVEVPADPRGWMRAACQARVGLRPVLNRQEAIEQRNRAVGDRWLKEQEESHAG